MAYVYDGNQDTVTGTYTFPTDGSYAVMVAVDNDTSYMEALTITVGNGSTGNYTTINTDYGTLTASKTRLSVGESVMLSFAGNRAPDNGKHNKVLVTDSTMSNWVTAAIDTTATVSGTWTPTAAGTYYVYSSFSTDYVDYNNYITITVR